MGYALVEGDAVFAFAGSACIEDWVRDFTAVKYDHPQLGTVHLGFWEGMQDLFNAVQEEVNAGNPLVVTGHSLGGAHAQLFTGLCIAAGLKVTQLILFAAPKAGMVVLKELVEAEAESIHTFRNLQDVVPELPVTVPVFEAWATIGEMEAFNESPAGGTEGLESVPKEHSIDLYIQGAEKLTY